jgi:hypothetical protein
MFAAAAVVVGVILQVALAPRYQFFIQINGRQLIVTNGKVCAAFVDEVREVCHEYGVKNGWVGGVKRGKAIALRFSRNIPPACQQRLRNVWFSS